jgi:hypothetical protein
LVEAHNLLEPLDIALSIRAKARFFSAAASRIETIFPRFETFGKAADISVHKFDVALSFSGGEKFC